VVADSIAGEKSGHLRVSDLSFKFLDVEAGFRFVDARRALFFPDLKPGAGHSNRLSGLVVPGGTGRLVRLPERG